MGKNLCEECGTEDDVNRASAGGMRFRPQSVCERCAKRIAEANAAHGGTVMLGTGHGDPSTRGSIVADVLNYLETVEAKYHFAVFVSTNAAYRELLVRSQRPCS